MDIEKGGGTLKVYTFGKKDVEHYVCLTHTLCGLFVVFLVGLKLVAEIASSALHAARPSWVAGMASLTVRNSLSMYVSVSKESACEYSVLFSTLGSLL